MIPVALCADDYALSPGIDEAILIRRGEVLVILHPLCLNRHQRCEFLG